MAFAYTLRRALRIASRLSCDVPVSISRVSGEFVMRCHRLTARSGMDVKPESAKRLEVLAELEQLQERGGMIEIGAISGGAK